MNASTDPIADMLTRIRNASAVRKHNINLPYSKVKFAVAKILSDNGFITKVKVKDAEDGIGKIIVLDLFATNSNPHITEIERISKPGRRSYTSVANIPTNRRGRGIYIISTSKGMMTGSDAKKAGIGGELICKVL
ncbi:MAG: 30S ribosomal protein S8 [bacterium]|jgi:small subunit ribosomal protein S8